jgi:hypothetical protein
MELGRLHTSHNIVRIMYARRISVGWEIQEILVRICWGRLSVQPLGRPRKNVAGKY